METALVEPDGTFRNLRVAVADGLRISWMRAALSRRAMGTFCTLWSMAPWVMAATRS